MDEIRTDPGIKLTHLFGCTFMSYIAIWSSSVFWLLLALYLWFSAIVTIGFWPNLTDEEIIEIRRREMQERQKEKDDSKGSDLQERPPEDTD